jgi:hypothetical protein
VTTGRSIADGIVADGVRFAGTMPYRGADGTIAGFTGS